MIEADYVVVGAGSAGCAVAARLSEDPDVTVAVLEAGPSRIPREAAVPAAFSKLFRSEFDWDHRTEPQPELDGRRLRWPRGRVLGGSSAINALMWVRGTAADYDAWAAAGNAGWGYDDVVEVFRRIERMPGGDPRHNGRDGMISLAALRSPNPVTRRFVEACVAVGIPEVDQPNGASNLGVAPTVVTQRRGRRHSAWDAYLAPVLDRPNLTVVTGALATRVLLEGDRAVGVELLHHVDPGRPLDRVRRTARARREVVLSGGAVNSPHLLLLSGIGPADELRGVGIAPAVDLPGVGRGLRDHLAVAVVVTTDRTDSLVSAERPRHLVDWLVRGRGPLTSNVAEAHAFVTTGDDRPTGDVELLFGAAPYIDQGAVVPTEHGYTVGAVLEQPASVGAVTLATDDPEARPRIDPRYLTEPADRRALTDGLRLALEVLAAPPLAEVVTGWLQPATRPERDDDLDAVIRRYADTLYHPIGTCQMGRDGDAVVDDRLRVHGVDALRVADASVMPSPISGHTHAPAVMIGERAAGLMTGSVTGRTP